MPGPQKKQQTPGDGLYATKTNNWHPQLVEEAKMKDVADQLPEMLQRHMERFEGCFHRSEQTFNDHVYVQGLLSNLERKSIEPIASELNEDPRGVRKLQHFMKDANWVDRKALGIYHKALLRNCPTLAVCSPLTKRESQKGKRIRWRRPQDITFQTKPDIALDFLYAVEHSGRFQARWIGVDSLYGEQ